MTTASAAAPSYAAVERTGDKGGSSGVMAIGVRGSERDRCGGKIRTTSEKYTGAVREDAVLRLGKIQQNALQGLGAQGEELKESGMGQKGIRGGESR